MKLKPWSRKIEKNILAVYAQATQAERIEGSQWYGIAHCNAQGIADACNIPLARAIGVIAAISPGLEWNRNLREAKAFCEAYVSGDKLPRVGIYGRQNTRKAERILSSTLDPIAFFNGKTGPKTLAFYACILAPENTSHVTIDGHAKCLALNIREDRWTRSVKNSVVKPAEYRHIARHYAAIAARLNLLPNQLQAICWLAWKRIVNEEPNF